MSNISLPRDNNRIAVIGGVSSSDGTTPTTIYVDPSTHRILVDASSGSSLTVGTTTIASGTTTRILYDNAGVLGEYTISGTGTVVAMATSPSFTTPTLGVASATTINKVTLTTPATSSTLTIIDGKTLTINKTISFTAADDTGVYTLPTGTKTLLATDGAGTSLTGIPYTLTGTANQVVLSAGTGNITFSLPQSIGTASSPQFATIELGAASDTTIARVSAGVISIEGIRVITSAGTTSGTILKNNGTTFVASTETYAAPGTSGQTLTSDGTNWTSLDPHLKAYHTTNFETQARFTTVLVGNGTTTWNVNGVNIDSSTTTTNSAQIQWLLAGTTATGNIYTGSPWFSASFCLGTAPTTGDMFLGLGLPTVAGAAITFTTKHIGFKVVSSAGPTHTLSATQGDGTTENASSLGTISDSGGGDLVEVALHVNGTSSVDYYWRINGGAWSAATNLTSNLPSGDTTNSCSFASSNHGTTQRNYLNVGSASYVR